MATSLESFSKQGYEEFIIAADLVNVLNTGEEIIIGSSEIFAIDKGAGSATDDILYPFSKTVSGSQLRIRCKGGIESKSPYKITFRAVTNEDNKWEVDVLMRVKEL